MAIARRLYAAGAVPWRMGSSDYLAAVAGLDPAVMLPSSGAPEPTPWDEHLAGAMGRANVAAHGEALLDVLLGDLTSQPDL